VAYSSGGFTLGYVFSSVAVADVNGDGKPDLVVANSGFAGDSDGSVSVLLGNGDGTFQPPVTYSSGQNWTGITVADVNGDGKPDVIVGNWPGAVGVFLGNGDGTFQPPVIYASGGTEVGDVAVADVNRDGKPDLIVANCGSGCDGGSVAVLLGNGDGTFQPAVNYGGGNGPYSVAVADVNGDGNPDVLVADFWGFQGQGVSTVAVLLGNGDGTFQPAVTYDSGGYMAWSIAVADVNGDGKPDVVVANECYIVLNGCQADGSVAVLLGNGDGTFQPAVGYDSGGVDSTGVAIADVNGDGKLDLLTVNLYSDTVAVLLGNGDGTFQPALTYGSGGHYPSSIAVADVNGDGMPDLVVNDGCGTTPPYSFSGAVGVLLHDNPTRATLISSLNPSVYGQPVMFTVAVSAATGTPTGTVIFYDGSTAIGSAVLANGSSSLSTSSLWAGSHSITAAYQSYDGFGPSTSAPLIQVVNGVATTTSLVSSANPSAFAQAVTFTAVVSAASGTPTGAVIFYDGSTAIGSATLANGNASMSVSTLAVGSHSITGAYQGSGEPSTSAPLNQIVNPAVTTALLVSSLNPAPAKQNVTYTATVTSQYGAAATGTATFQDGGSAIATVPLASSQATYSTSYKSAGVHAITATYSGDVSNLGSISAALMEYIGSATSKTVVTTSGSPSLVGQPVTFTATVTSKNGKIPDGELVTFYDDGTASGTGTTAGGVATFTTSSLTAKTHTIKANYNGDDTFESTTGTVKQVVNKYSTTTALSSSSNPSAYEQAVTFTATVASSESNAPTGKVAFKDGTTGIGAVDLNGGVATLTKPRLAVGTHPVTAEYLGDAHNAESMSPVLDQVVQ
jgi:hypothetical protein